MTAFAELGDRLKTIYGQWSLYADMAARFVLSLVSFLWIRNAAGSRHLLLSIPVILIAAGLTAILSANFAIYPAMIMLIAAGWERGPDIAAVTAAVLLAAWLLFIRFAPDDAGYALLFALTAYMGFAPLIPIYCGLRRKVTAAFALIGGVMFYVAVYAFSVYAEGLPVFDGSNFADRLKIFLGGICSAETAVLAIAAVCAFFVTRMVRRQSFDYAFYLAPVFGGALYLFCVFLGNASAGTEIGLLQALVGTAASVFVLILYLMVFLPLDFKKSEQLRFEDDDYYYYIKAVPKAVTADFGDEDEEED